jgi:hypothetical protein
MAAIAALLDVTAESGGAATLDRGHGAPPRGDSDAPCWSRKAGPKWRNTSATSSPSRATEPARQAGTRSGTVGTMTSQRFQRTGGGADLAGGDHEISRRGAQIAMTEQQLDGAQIGAGSSR